MARFRRGLLSAGDACGELDLSRSRFYVLYGGYQRACAERRQRSWRPGHSGGNHHCRWPLEVTALLRKLLNARPAVSYSFAASEVHRRHHLKIDRASVRRWALAQALAPDTKYKPPRKPVRRWQVQQIGQLWQYDASPLIAGLPSDTNNSLCWRTSMITVAWFLWRGSIHARHSWLISTFSPAPFWLVAFLSPSTSIIIPSPSPISPMPSLELGAALHFYEVSLRFAPTPQAKGKIERRHDFWQKRLPALFAAEQVSALPAANALLDQVRHHHNVHEKHREIGSTPQAAWELARREKRSVLRPAPRCPWWPYVWSQRSPHASRIRRSHRFRRPTSADR